MDLFDDIKNVIVAPSMNEHKKSMDSENPRDFMDVYLTQVKNTSDPNSSFHGKKGEESLIATMIDLFLAGNKIKINFVFYLPAVRLVSSRNHRHSTIQYRLIYEQCVLSTV